MAERELWAMLHLMDRQLIDRDGVSAGKIDDLVFSEPAGADQLPVLTDILTGVAALGRRLFGVAIGAELQRARCIATGDAQPPPEPARIPMAAVRKIGSHIDLNVARDDLDVTRLDRWLARAVLSHVPGSGIERR